MRPQGPPLIERCSRAHSSTFLVNEDADDEEDARNEAKQQSAALKLIIVAMR
jgi:hypothetical protein